MHDALRRQREAVFFRAIGNVIEDVLAQGDPVRIHVQSALQPSGEQFESFRDVTDDLGLGKIHLFNGCRREPDVNDLMAIS